MIFFFCFLATFLFISIIWYFPFYPNNFTLDCKSEIMYICCVHLSFNICKITLAPVLSTLLLSENTNNTYKMLTMWWVLPWTFFRGLTNLIFTSLWSMFYYYHQFIDEETWGMERLRSLGQGHTARKERIWYL